MALFCTNCGAELEPNAKFCAKCGSKYEPTQEEQAKETNKKPKLKFIIGGIIVVVALVLAVIFLFPKKPIPFCDFKWGDSPEKVIDKMGNNYEELTSNEDTYRLDYKNKSYDGYKGYYAFYFLDDDGLYRAEFREDEYDEDAYNHFYDVFEKKYGKPDYVIGAGARWNVRGGVVYVMGVDLFGGYTTVGFANTSDYEESNDSDTADEEESGFAPDTKEVIKFSRNEAIKAENCEFTLKGYVISSKIEPDNPPDYYTYFEADSGNTFVDVKFDIKNTARSAVEQDEIIDIARVIYDDNYEYNCACVTVDSDGDFEEYTSLYSIEPLETKEYHMMVKVPAEVETSNGSLVVQVEVDGNIYECKLR